MTTPDPSSVLAALQKERYRLTGEKPANPKPSTPIPPVIHSDQAIVQHPLRKNQPAAIIHPPKYLQNIHSNNRAPNYREKGQLRLRECFDCQKKLVLFGASNITTCPYCRWCEAENFDWCEMQLVAFQALCEQINLRHPRKPFVAGVIAAMIVNMEDELGWQFLSDENIIYDYELKEIEVNS